jgi:predicted nucleic acid-binding protein
MKYVLDASVALKWVLTEPDTVKAVSLRADFATGSMNYLPPTFSRSKLPMP